MEWIDNFPGESDTRANIMPPESNITMLSTDKLQSIEQKFTSNVVCHDGSLIDNISGTNLELTYDDGIQQQQSNHKVMNSKDYMVDSPPNSLDMDTTDYESEHCMNTFKENSTLENHIKESHTSDIEKTFKCNECGKSFESSTSLNLHVKVHGSRETCKCSHCGRIFHHVIALEMHQLKNHGESGIFECGLCGKVFKSKKSTLNHAKIHHSDNSGEKQDIGETYEKSYKERKSFNQHLSQKSCEKELANDTMISIKKEKRETAKKFHKCQTCGKSYTQSGSLNRHLKCHDRHSGNQHSNRKTKLRKKHQKKKYKCKICEKSFTHSGSLNRHIKLQHCSEKKTFDNITDQIETYKFETCEEVFTEKEHLNKHLENEHNREEMKSDDDNQKKKYKCETCEKLFTQIWSLNRHTKQQHSSEKTNCDNGQRMNQELPHVCTTCNEAFSSKHLLVNHEGQHKLKTCNICGLIFPNLKHLSVHKKKIHTERKVRLYHCISCEKVFRDRSGFYKHRMLHNPNNPFTCEFCGKRHRNKSDLNKHTRKHTGEKPYKCDICSKTFASMKSYKNHKDTHYGETFQKCTHCQELFTDKAKLLRHVSTQHGNNDNMKTQKIHECQICGKKFGKKSHLDRHKDTHSSEKPHKCKICDKSFKSNFYLKRHLLLHSKPAYQCTQCGKCLSAETSLRDHERSHTGEKPYICDICGKSFGKYCILYVHKQIHSEGKPHKCAQCGKSFKTKNCLTKHIIVQHNSKKKKDGSN